MIRFRFPHECIKRGSLIYYGWNKIMRIRSDARTFALQK